MGLMVKNKNNDREDEKKTIFSRPNQANSANNGGTPKKPSMKDFLNSGGTYQKNHKNQYVADGITFESKALFDMYQQEKFEGHHPKMAVLFFPVMVIVFSLMMVALAYSFTVK